MEAKCERWRAVKTLRAEGHRAVTIAPSCPRDFTENASAKLRKHVVLFDPLNSKVAEFSFRVQQWRSHPTYSKGRADSTHRLAYDGLLSTGCRRMHE
jgi:UDP:flavonoid glycosyltransferase YjiC (YdhE family)